MFRTIATLLVALLILFPAGSGSAHAQARELTAEIIVFRLTGDTGHGEESWLSHPGLPQHLADAVELNSERARELSIRRGGDAQLAHVVQRLRNNDRYQVLTHQRFTLPETARENAPTLRLFLDQRPDEATTEQARRQRPRTFQDEHLVDDDAEQPAREDQDETMDVARPLDGTLQVYRNRFFHVAVDLIFNPELDDPGSRRGTAAQERQRDLQQLLLGHGDFSTLREEAEEEAFLGYRLTDRRRIQRLGAIHYIDHPRFGVLVHLSRPD